MAFRWKRLLAGVNEKLGLDDPVVINAYMGYASKNYLYCRGRVLENEGEVITEKDSIWKNFINSLKRIESDEIPFAPVQVKFRGQNFRTKADKEGFFQLERKVKLDEIQSSFETIEYAVKGSALPQKYIQKDISAEGEIFFPNQDAQYGIISDIDDTLLKTDVLSNFKWRAMYNSLFIKAKDRMPIYDVDAWYRKLVKGQNGLQNPIFYISHSPWNLYYYLRMFMQVYKFPKGPILLRDFGLKNSEQRHLYYNHKTIEIERILKAYPKLQFVLMGDGAERDHSIYLKIHKNYPGRIKAIFIRKIGSTSNRAKLERIAAKNSDIFHLIKAGKDGMKISKQIGLI